MPASSLFSRLLKDLREQLGWTQEEVASYLNVNVSIIQQWEDEKSAPPLQTLIDRKELKEHLPAYPGSLSNREVQVLRRVAAGKSNREIAEELVIAEGTARRHVINLLNKTGAMNRSELTRYAQRAGLAIDEETQETPQSFTETSDRAMVPVLNPSLLTDLVSILVNAEHVPLRIHYSHTMPDHGSQIVDEGKWQQAPKESVVFQSKEAKLLVEALENPDHTYGQQAKQAMRRFIKAVEKDKAKDLIKDRGILTDQASRKYGVPARTLASWGDMGLLPVLYKGRGKQGVYLDEEAVARVAPVYHEAKQRGEQPAKRLKAMLAQQAEGDRQLSH